VLPGGEFFTKLSLTIVKHNENLHAGKGAEPIIALGDQQPYKQAVKLEDTPLAHSVLSVGVAHTCTMLLDVGTPAHNSQRERCWGVVGVMSSVYGQEGQA